MGLEQILLTSSLLRTLQCLGCAAALARPLVHERRSLHIKHRLTGLHDSLDVRLRGFSPFNKGPNGDGFESNACRQHYRTVVASLLGTGIVCCGCLLPHPTIGSQSLKPQKPPITEHQPSRATWLSTKHTGHVAIHVRMLHPSLLKTSTSLLTTQETLCFLPGGFNPLLAQ
jgi:hypothetical protein